MKPKPDHVFHEAAHVAAARLLGVGVAGVTFHAPAFNDGNAGLTYLADAASCSPLDRSIIGFAPTFVAPLGTDWWSPAFEGDREIAARVMPAHWLSVELWFPHVEDKTRELVRSERWWSTFTEVVDELERLEVT